MICQFPAYICCFWQNYKKFAFKAFFLSIVLLLSFEFFIINRMKNWKLKHCMSTTRQRTHHMYRNRKAPVLNHYQNYYLDNDDRSIYNNRHRSREASTLPMLATEIGMSRSILLVFALLLCGAHSLDKETFLKYLSVKEIANSRCRAHVEALLDGLQKGSTWALTSK